MRPHRPKQEAVKEAHYLNLELRLTWYPYGDMNAEDAPSMIAIEIKLGATPVGNIKSKYTSGSKLL